MVSEALIGFPGAIQHGNGSLSEGRTMRNRGAATLALAALISMIAASPRAWAGSPTAVSIDGVAVSDAPAGGMTAACGFVVTFPGDGGAVAAARLSLWPPGAAAPTNFLVERSAGVSPGGPTAISFDEDEIVRALAGAGAKRLERGYRVRLTAWADHESSAAPSTVVTLWLDGCPQYPAEPITGDLASSTTGPGGSGATSGWPAVLVIGVVAVAAVVISRRLATRWLAARPPSGPPVNSPNG